MILPVIRSSTDPSLAQRTKITALLSMSLAIQEQAPHLLGQCATEDVARFEKVGLSYLRSYPGGDSTPRSFGTYKMAWRGPDASRIAR